MDDSQNKPNNLPVLPQDNQIKPEIKIGSGLDLPEKINIQPKPETRVMPPIPPINQIKPATPDIPALKSVLRTMESDLAQLNKGQKPGGIGVDLKPEKLPEIKPAQPIAQVPIPKPEKQGMQATLGEAEKSKALNIEIQKPKAAIPPPPNKIVSTSSLPDKPKKNFAKKFLIIVAIVAVIVICLIFLLTKTSSTTPTPTPSVSQSTLPSSSVSPTASPSGSFSPSPTASGSYSPTPESNLLLSQTFGQQEIVVNSSGAPASLLLNSIDSISLTDLELKGLSVVDEAKKAYDLKGIFSRFLVSPPNDFINNLDSSDWTMIAFGQKEKFNSQGIASDSVNPYSRWGLVSKVKNPTALRSALNLWEKTMASDTKDLLGHNPSDNKFTLTFMNNTYNKIVIRYMNFPYPDKTVDYAIFESGDNTYFAIFNSRQGLYQLIDALTGE